MKYETVYEVTNASLLDITHFVPILMAIGGFYLFYDTFRKNKNESKNSRDYFALILGLAIGIFFTTKSIIRIPNSLDKFNKTKQLYHNKEYKIIEGKIENFDPMPYTGHKLESFTVAGVPFEYTDYSGGYYGFHNSASHGGPITSNGQEVRIGYITDKYGENIILKIELNK